MKNKQSDWLKLYTESVNSYVQNIVQFQKSKRVSPETVLLFRGLSLAMFSRNMLNVDIFSELNSSIIELKNIVSQAIPGSIDSKLIAKLEEIDLKLKLVSDETDLLMDVHEREAKEMQKFK